MKPLPTTRIWMDEDYLVVNESDVDQWIAQGWSTNAPVDAAPPLFAEPPAKRKRRGTSATGDEVAQAHDEVE